MFKLLRLIPLLLVLVLAALPAAAVEPAPGIAREVGIFELTAYAPDGAMIWSEEAHNNLADEGEQAFLDIYLRGATGPTQFYLGLADSSTPCSIAETNTLTTASAGEPSGNSYARQLIERSNTGWPTLALDSGDYMATSSTETFTASGAGWGPVYCVFLGTTSDNTGKHISYAPLSTARTLAAGESLQITYRVKLQ